jgi:hypothetical protein
MKKIAGAGWVQLRTDHTALLIESFAAIDD